MTELPFFGYSLYEMFHMFCFWSFIGWCIEVVYMTLETGEYQNRGFLNMPICPIYGFGVLMVAIFFRPIQDNGVLLFLVTMLLCTGFELLVGLGMEKMFHTRWWDYSNEKFNFKGYICLKVSLLWGFGCVFVIKIVQPVVEKFVDWLPLRAGMIIIIVMSVLIVIDLVSSIAAVNKLNSRLQQIDDISRLMLKSSIKIGENLSNETNEIRSLYEKIIESRDNATQEIKDKVLEIAVAQELKMKYEKLVKSDEAVSPETKNKILASFVSDIKERYEKLVNTRDAAIERLIRAYPNMRSLTYSDSMEKIKEKLYSRSSKGASSKKDSSPDKPPE